ncbi:hypothetical protein TraAM80_08261 [Trypanosoma rangeli]|uniref:WW domain-containing protein n=1 Tax=Trypanosoma rangeli TaxID=5698 RepID=A0A3R7LL16_TRYRA|nr:uncharacterized protein TraAM80_08261 [Trypanosoma rangeli]RNE99292.1 hypothetical protein TraAM80_08261 [Trypanosoma rangeli]|eukprot:RNE99292.1 hypothetical protein TraAM80_08261 [Trypanosoma rangeli]
MWRVVHFPFRCISLRRIGSFAKVKCGAGKILVKRGEVSSATVLPEVDLALRVINPCREFPATQVGVELPDHSDPCVLWREYYSFDHCRPYYHNLLTNTTTFELPSGFMTRFALFCRRQGHHVDGETRVYRQTAAEGSGGSDKGAPEGPGGEGGSPVPPGEGGSLTTKQKLAAYGGGGLLLYLIVHNILLACIFFSLYFLHVDLVGVARSYGFRVGSDKTESDDGGNAAVDKRKSPSFWATLGASVVLNKLLVPLEVAATLMMAPVLVPRLQPFAARIIPCIKSFMKG